MVAVAFGMGLLLAFTRRRADPGRLVPRGEAVRTAAPASA
jgi:hypothetical protein